MALTLRPPADLERVNLRWLVLLRWLLVGCATVLVTAVEVALGGLPVVSLLVVVAVAAAPNVWLSRRIARPGPVPGQGLVTALLIADVGLLTTLLALSGGPHNPFAVLYLLEVMIAALVLPPSRAAVVGIVGGVAYGGLFLVHVPLHIHSEDQLQSHLLGMWLAYGVAAPFVGYGVHQLRRGIAEADAALADAHRRAEQSERLAALATLAAGAAHEHANPLAQLALVAGELERSDQPSVVEDARLVRWQVERCREVLVQLSAEAGAGTGESPRRVTVRALLDEALAERPEVRLDRLDADERVRGLEVVAPVRLMGQALRRLIVNARQASAEGGPVVLEVRADPAEIGFAVVDVGAGMASATLARAGEPFFTTRPGGMGLGLYFARSVAETAGGRLELRSTPGLGTTATIALPLAGVGP